MSGVEWSSVERICTYAIEIIVLIFIYRELRELRRHSAALARHEGKLDQVRPLISTLYTSSDEILQLAVEFTKTAKHIRAVGSISVLSETEIRPNEEVDKWRMRIASISELRRNYAAATLDFIQSGRHYHRVMNFSPNALGDPELLLEILANVRFFLRAMESAGSRVLQLHLYHDPSLVAGREDFHYRVSDHMVIVRVGGPSRVATNAAIAISDSKVIDTFVSAYSAQLDRPRCKEITLDTLRKMNECLETRDLSALDRLLEEV